MFDKQVDIDDESVVEVDDVTETYAIYEVFKVVLVGSRRCNYSQHNFCYRATPGSMLRL